jgi:hypothetical protein
MRPGLSPVLACGKQGRYRITHYEGGEIEVAEADEADD